MKKIICVLLLICVLFSIFSEGSITSVAASQESIAEKVIRFHVIANSDEKKDQDLKLLVKNKVLDYMYPILLNSKDIEESRKILIDQTSNIKKIAGEVISANGYNYAVEVKLSKENFPVKSYGNITLPQGSYEAYRIIIGRGEGQNWWCVMFPPLCFIDVTKSELSKQKTEEGIKKVLSKEEFEIVDNLLEPNSSNSLLNTNNINGEKIVVKSKLIETIKKILGKKSEIK